jgi:MoaA/NifB/PqqE/SkfB family radical SAM enzyme
MESQLFWVGTVVTLKKWELLWHALRGRTRTAIFSVTTRCNCKCAMCGIPKMDKVTIPLRRAKEVIDDCSRNGVLFMSFTGGEPLMHPDIGEILSYANAKGMFIHVASNGTMPERIKMLSGLVDLIGFSLDSHIPEEHNRNRGRRSCSDEVAKSVRISHMLGMKSFVNTPPNQMIKDRIEDYVSFVNEELDCPVGFCYPMVDNGGYYDKGSNVVSVLKPSEIVRFYAKAIELKRNHSKITNTDGFLRESISYTLGHKVSPCRAGKCVVWIDWEGAVHPCFNKGTTRLDNGNHRLWSVLDTSKCNECFNQCFREPSIVDGDIANMIRDWRLYRYLI